MPRFYFHILDGKSLTDDLGVELADIAAAKVEALRFAGAVLNEDRPVNIWENGAWGLRVTSSPSSEGPALLTLSLFGTGPAENF